MAEEVICAECGTPLRASLVSKTNSLCSSCRKKRLQKNPFFVLYSSLIERVHKSPEGFAGLSEPEKLFYTVSLLRNEINSGGFDQYFRNSSGSYYSHAENGLRILGATQTLELLQEAKTIVFSDKAVPEDSKLRRSLIPDFDPRDTSPEWSTRLNDLDRRFYASPDELTPKLKVYAWEHGLVPPETESNT